MREYNDMPQALEEPRMTIGRALENLEACLQLTEALISGNPVSEPKMSGATVASAPLIRYREHIEEVTKRLADINQKLTVL